jgi:hypothetical protein
MLISPGYATANNQIAIATENNESVDATGNNQIAITTRIIKERMQSGIIKVWRQP